MIVLVAPYSPAGSCAEPHLGASRKIEVVIEALSRADPDVVLVNSAHNDVGWLKNQLVHRVIGDVLVRELLPRRWPNRRLGKLLNLFGAALVARQVRALEKSRMVWLYNAYAFESLAGRLIGRNSNCPVVLEFEDGHFARGVTTKAMVDYFCWRLSRGVVSHATVVNQALGRHFNSLGIPTTLLPGLIPDELLVTTGRRVPFSESGALPVIGYFGGLNREKGFGLLLDAIPLTRGRARWLVTGHGPLATRVSDLAQQMPDVLEFRGTVAQAELYESIACCDVIVNPHSSIDEMGDGVFPFKVVEAIASGRLLLSTTLPALAIDGLMDGVVEIDGSLANLLSTIARVRELFLERRILLARAQAVAVDNFGTAMLDNVVRNLLDSSAQLDPKIASSYDAPPV